ncbi:hypothetical protein EDS67_17660 [candidate division KSB1 bacterium]|nr:MAG: hypothetical protein EDS67_17660 [candidate division KSB1 bacterium]MBC6950439.1 hypothetical protein [candidate division KSB1 bacterium]MCE7942347.1 hypothetical protein [Chlorobi bacterium CHB1]MDL1875054.1 hypothetical protein [Cytophagia bacterium CHB2]
MEISFRWLHIAIALFLLAFTKTATAQQVVVDEIQISRQPLRDGEFQLHAEFKLPDFAGVPVEQINIDYAVLELEVLVKTAAESDFGALEILAAGENKSAPLAGLNYNLNPVTARIHQNRTGFDRVEFDITQLVRAWLHQAVPNHGLLLVSHRRVGEKSLQENRLILPNGRAPKVTIYYTVLDE